MENFKKVAVIMSVYNSSKFLYETLMSVYCQTYKEIQIYCVNDGSNDDTGILLDYFKDKYGRLKILHHEFCENKGQAASLNYAFENILDEHFVAILDGDDIWYPDKIEKQVDYLVNSAHVDLVYSNGDKINENGCYLWPFLPQFHQETGRSESILLDCYIAPSSVLFRRDLWCRLGGFDEEILTADHDFFVKAYESGVVGYLPDKLFAYRIHTGQISKNIQTRYDAFKALKKAIIRKNYPLRVCRKRFAVCCYNLSEALWSNKYYLKSIFYFILSGISDPLRGMQVLVKKVKIT